MRLWTIILPLLLSVPAVAGNFEIQAAFASDPGGVEIQPNLGEPFWITVQYNVNQGESATMTVSNPWLKLASPTFYSEAGTRQATYGPLRFLSDESMTVSVVLGDTNSSLRIAPSRPGKSIEYFTPRTWNASFGASMQLNSGQTGPSDWLLPNAPSFGFQSVSVTDNFLSSLISGDVFKVKGDLAISSSFSATTSNVRVDSSALRRVGFASLKRLPADVKRFTKAEKLIESGDRSVKAFVSATLPRQFARTMPVFDAAKALFQATVARVQYVHNPVGLPSAGQALRTGIGDCGFYAAVFVAACRQAGIPARPITGFMAGTSAWHVWAEFYVPGHGWVPVDPSFADGVDPNGIYPLYFGVIPDLNQRVATAVGFEHSFGKTKVPILQSPLALVDANKVTAFQTWSSLIEIP